MRKIAILSAVLTLVCALALSAQETDTQEIYSKESNAQGSNIQESYPLESESGDGKKSFFNISVSGEAVWAPLVYRADMDGIVGAEPDSDQEGPGLGVGASGWGGIGAALDFAIWGNDATESIGYEVHIKPQAMGGNFSIADNMAYIWARPFAMLKIQLGNYQWNDMLGKIGPIGEVYGGYGGGENDIFQGLESDVFGAMFILTPPSGVPEALEGLTIFSSFGVSGWLDPNDEKSFSARAGKFFQYVFSTPHAGIAYRHDAFGLARVQFIGSNYFFGDGLDWATYQTPSSYGSSNSSFGWFPARSREAARLEFALNLTSIPFINLDLGFGFAFPVTVKGRDGTASNRGIDVGPTLQEIGYRQRLGVDNERIAQQIGDVWQPPIKISLGLDFLHEDTGLGFRFRTKAEFGEQVAFTDGSDNYESGLIFEAGLEPSYTIGNIGTALFYTAIRVKENSSYNGKKTDSANRNELSINSVNHNGTVDLGLGAFFTRPFMKNNYIKIGVCATLPVSGDRYFWSDDTLTSGDFGADWTEAYKKGKLVVAIPLILALNF